MSKKYTPQIQSLEGPQRQAQYSTEKTPGNLFCSFSSLEQVFPTQITEGSNRSKAKIIGDGRGARAATIQEYFHQELQSMHCQQGRTTRDSLLCGYWTHNGTTFLESHLVTCTRNCRDSDLGFRNSTLRNFPSTYNVDHDIIYLTALITKVKHVE